MKKSDLKIGQTVYFRPNGYNDKISTGEITKIGRVYFYVNKSDSSNELKVAIKEMRVYVNDYGWDKDVYLSETEIKEEDEFNKLKCCIQDRFTTFGRYPFKLTLNQLRDIWKIIEGSEK